MTSNQRLSATQQAGQTQSRRQSTLRDKLVRRFNEFKLIGQDPILTVGLLVVSVFVYLFIILPLIEVIVQGFFVPDLGNNADAGAFSLEYFLRYIDPIHRTHQWNVLRDTMLMGLLTATSPRRFRSTNSRSAFSM